MSGAHGSTHGKHRWVCGRCGYDLTEPTGEVCPECGSPIEKTRVRASGRKHGLFILAGLLAAIEFLVLALISASLAFQIGRSLTVLISNFAAVGATIFFIAAVGAAIYAIMKNTAGPLWFALLAITILLFITVIVGVIFSFAEGVLRSFGVAVWFFLPNLGIALVFRSRLIELRSLER
jgi:hypothetical protein